MGDDRNQGPLVQFAKQQTRENAPVGALYNCFAREKQNRVPRGELIRSKRVGLRAYDAVVKTIAHLERNKIRAKDDEPCSLHFLARAQEEM